MVSTSIIYSLHSSGPDAIYQSQAVLPRNIADILLLSGYQGNRSRKSTEGPVLIAEGGKGLLTHLPTPQQESSLGRNRERWCWPQ